MIGKLLVLTCACALGGADMVPFGDTVESLYKAYEILQDNILSMDGNIPLLNDPRRHYAEIIHVIQDEAQRERSCVGHDYFGDYQKNINISANFALVNPQSVVDETNKIITDISNRVYKVVQMLQAIGEQSDLSDEDVTYEDQTNMPIKNYGLEWEIFLTSGLVATHLNQYHKDYFALHSQNLTAHNFVITGAAKLKKIVMSLTILYKTMYEPGSRVQC